MYRDKQSANNQVVYGLDITPMGSCGVMYDKYEDIVLDCPIISPVFSPGTSTKQLHRYVYTDNLYILNRYIQEIKSFVSSRYIKKEVSTEERTVIEEDIDGYIHTKFRIETCDHLSMYKSTKLTSVSSVFNYEPFVYANTDQIYFRYFASQFITISTEMQQKIIMTYLIMTSIVNSDVICESDNKMVWDFLLRLNHIITKIYEVMSDKMFDIKYIAELNDIIDTAVFLNGLYLFK